jgi:hypothetical protein
MNNSSRNSNAGKNAITIRAIRGWRRKTGKVINSDTIDSVVARCNCRSVWVSTWLNPGKRVVRVCTPMQTKAAPRSGVIGLENILV